MGRLKIKKKEGVIPFRETLGYRMILLGVSIITFLVVLYIMVSRMQAGLTTPFIAAAVIGVGAAFAIFYNLDHMRDARIPKRTLSRMKRR